MKKLYIVKSAREFEAVIKTGKVYKNKNLIIYMKNNNLPFSRFGVSVGKKLGNAVYRNKYKRKLRQIIDNNKKDYIKNKDYIIILRGSAKDKTFYELNDAFIQLMNIIGKDMNYGNSKKQEKQ